jgi:hypothetical protein
MVAGSQSAVAVALAVARAQGVRCEDPVVLREAWHVLVHLAPSPIVARVSTGLASPGGPKPADVVRELAVASHAARLGAPVVPPTEELDPGPHWREALFIPRRVIHGFSNGGDVDARFLAIISPGLLGSGYFREVADVLAGDGPPDVEMLGEVMRRHGLTPAPPA